MRSTMPPAICGFARRLLGLACLCGFVVPNLADEPALWDNTPPTIEEDGLLTLDARAPMFRAFWADAFSSGFKSTSQITSMVSRAVSGNYNVIIAEVLAYQDTGSGGHGAYWNSSIVPKASDITGGIDPLATLVSQAHAQGLQVHAWLVPYRISTTWPPPGNAYLAARPYWTMVPQAYLGTGPAKIDNKYFLDPGSPEVQEYLTSIVRELVTNYQIDGINYDYIRYVDEDAGYPADATYEFSSLERFRTITGYAGTPPPEGNTSWDDFRRRTIDELVRRTRAEIPWITSNPRQPLRFTCDLICWGNAPAAFNNSDAYKNVFQNWRYWLEQGWLDTGIPMNYKREWDATEAAWYRNWVDAAIGWGYNRQVVCGQGNYLNPKAMSVTQLQYCINAGADGTCNYSYYDTCDENMNGSSENDWTWYTYVSTNLFTTAVPVPTMPWRDPAAATEGTLWGCITDGLTGDPIDNANVQAGTSLPAVKTDGNGLYVLTQIPAAAGGTAYTVTASKTGHPTGVVTGVVVLPGQIVRQNITLGGTPVLPGDMNLDGDVDFSDFGTFRLCLHGPELPYLVGHLCTRGDGDDDLDLDLADFAVFQQNFTGPL